jgi:hypothetical protein
VNIIDEFMGEIPVFGTLQNNHGVDIIWSTCGRNKKIRFFLCCVFKLRKNIFLLPLNNPELSCGKTFAKGLGIKFQNVFPPF